MSTARKKTTIYHQIASGYRTMIILLVVLVLTSCACLALIGFNYKTVNKYRNNQTATMEAVVSHYDWLDRMNVSIQTGTAFTGNLDYNTCSLGQWLSSVAEADRNDPAVKAALQTLQQPHQLIHSTASDIIALSKEDHEKGFEAYMETTKPQAEIVISELKKISSSYMLIADRATRTLDNITLFSLILNIVFVSVSAILATKYGSSLAKKISTPIIEVSRISKNLALGKDEALDDNTVVNIGNNTAQEITDMMDAFTDMANSIKENVDVVKRVADGDMTAFVNIRSKEDSLGKNLYKMVQSNDLLFAEILGIAQQVAGGSEQIANASQTLATSSSIQAEAIHNLSLNIDRAGVLIEQNTDKTERTQKICAEIRVGAQQSSEKLSALVKAVDNIRDSSQKVSTVIKSIDDIAFQTNILALNASVEAARAGASGKGFAVVAGEVRQLAIKCAKAAADSSELIEDAVNKSISGASVSGEASALFEHMLMQLGDIVKMVDEIYAASGEQKDGIFMVRKEIEGISDAASGNASVSEESAAASRQMSSHADLLKQAMNKFNLRQRQHGRPYIPKEKENDMEFIREAEANYQRALKQGTFQSILRPE